MESHLVELSAQAHPQPAFLVQVRYRVFHDVISRRVFGLAIINHGREGCRRGQVMHASRPPAEHRVPTVTLLTPVPRTVVSGKKTERDDLSIQDKLRFNALEIDGKDLARRCAPSIFPLNGYGGGKMNGERARTGLRKIRRPVLLAGERVETRSIDRMNRLCMLNTLDRRRANRCS